MKKLLALLLALCMALAAAPVTAEEDVSGSWYLVMVGLTCADIELNADGTCTLQMSGAEEGKKEGTWTLDGDKVTVKVGENTLPLIYDGASLQFNFEDLAAFGMDASSLGGMDMSLFSGLIGISREPGKLTMGELNAYQADGTLPEGKTEEDMQAIQAEMMSAVMQLMGSAGFSADGSGAGQEAAAPELTIVEENFYLRESYDEAQEGFYIAKVQNNTETPAYISEGSLTLLDANGNEVGKTEFMGNTGSRYLEPGEATFVTMMADVNAGAEVTDRVASVKSSAVNYQTPDTAIEVADAQLRVEEGDYYTSYVTAATVTNTTDAPLSRINAIVAVRDSNGKLVDLTSSGLYQNELGAGSTITLIDSLDSRTVTYVTENGLAFGEVEAIAWVDSY